MSENTPDTDYKTAKTSVSVILPAYNEERRIKQTISGLRSYLKSKKYIYEIIAVDDGSTDRTVNVLKDMLASDLRIITITKSGKGTAVKEGILSANYEYVFFMDADLSTDVSEITKFINIFKKEKDLDVIIGSRYLPDGSVIIQPPFRNFVGKTFSFVKSKLLGINFYDSQCGFKAFRLETAKKIFSKSAIKGFSFDVEILYIALLNNIKVKEVSVEWKHKPGGHVNIIADSVPMLIELFQIFLNKNNYYF
ncbi:MAG: glycosyltransferase family 2 protein [Candidatus Acidulodesulfobacterium ferriphilum]|jgi:dolichyl-phosphate beta-glucosyltransferase|uniref:dolichyl-phosphate beta-glucosyltransferase n=1 Tax=Candidatus Acidulodesulfobacterium ferriphilum TaxID=2597223 RepID=A0A519BB01_9DELT|nr:MAG: glycosyltransferase family 2 protein [Candidatus Acidulodesulfobacterium ferriphilum]